MGLFARWLRAGTVASLASAGCATSSGVTSLQEERTEAQDVRIDLGPAGMAATIVAPRSARVNATSDGVELRGGDGFHLHVERGSLDPLVEKAWIVREYGNEFRRFIRDRGQEVVYEVSAAGHDQFHFFLTRDDTPSAYHCRSPEDGVPSLSLIEAMIAACRQVRHRFNVEPRSAEAPMIRQ